MWQEQQSNTDQQSEQPDPVPALPSSASRSPPVPASGPRPKYGFQLSRINGTVVAVLLVFVYLYCVDVLLIIVPWLSYSVPGVTNLGVLTTTTFMALYCYMFCVVMDAGSVPEGWRPDEERSVCTEVKRKDGAHRFCQKCQEYKPPRTHHCRVCNRCVLRMDHHCPWTNNCIGHANYRAFMLFLIHVSAALVHTVGLICAHLLHALQTSQQQRVFRTGPGGDPVELQQGWHKRVWVYVSMQTLAFALSLPLCVGLLMLLGWHLHLIAANKTTIEYQEGVRSSVQAYTGAPLYEHPYDLGLCTNLHETLGDSPMEWCTPPCQGAQGGTQYRTIWDERALGLS